ncbi:gephyrin-like molybdotransferase Glp [Georhizobium sp. MAB10]|uniref:molybdopterin molybdotransferase MoeA n=1 Tax=Georhizobium sp. MAB10 TaxID=3028319 RepID=UPI003855B6BE
MALLPVDDALELILADARTIADIEHVPLHEAWGRIVAEPLIAMRDQPPFPASAMDGYAVIAADTAEPGATLRVIGESAAGHGFTGAIGRGETVRIFTGAPVPEGADAILIQENARPLEKTMIEVIEPVQVGRFVRRAGLDFHRGETVIAKGAMLDAGRLTLAAAMNLPALPVHRRPRVAILATGDELVPPGADPRDDQIIASNSFGVAAIVREAGGEPIDLGIAADTLDGLNRSIDSAQAAGADILVTLGGASVGDHDLVRKVLESRGLELAFWKIAMRPGKPLMSGRIGPMHVLGLPGNPVSSLVCSHVFLTPLIAKLVGRTHHVQAVDAILDVDLAENDVRQDYLRAAMSRRADGTLVVRPATKQDSSMMRVFAEADGLVVRPPFAPAAKAGDTVRAILLRRI